MATVDELMNTLERFQGKWTLGDKIKKLAGDDKAAMGALVWQARRSGRLTMEQANLMLIHFPGAPALWDADDFCELVEELQRCFPDGRFQGSAWGWCGTMPGSASGLHDMLAEKAGDAAFGAAMAARWRQLPDFWQVAISCWLVCYGHIPYDALPLERRRELARLHLEHAAVYPVKALAERATPEAWGADLAAVAGGPDDFGYKNESVTRELLPYADRAQTMKALARIKPVSVASSAAVQLLDERVDRGWVMAAIAEHADAPWPSPLKVLLTSLARRLEDGERLPESVDGALRTLLDNDRLGAWGEDKELIAALHALPAERAEALALGRAIFQWEVLMGHPTPAVAAAVAAQLIGDTEERELPGDLRYFSAATPLKGWSLYPLRELLFAPTLAALGQRPDHPRSRLLLRILAMAPGPGAAPIFFDALGSKEDDVKAHAMLGIVALGPEPCLAPIRALLDDSKKEGRLAAAEVMAALPPHADLYELAQERLKKERVKAVKALLETVRPPAGAASGQAAVALALEADQGACWEAHAGDPRALSEAFWGVLSRAFFNKTVPAKAPLYLNWVAAQGALAGLEDAPMRALRLLPAVAYDGSDYLSALLKIYPREVLYAELERWLLKKKWPGRPAELGTAAPAWSPDSAVRWLEWRPLQEAGAALVAAATRPKKDGGARARAALVAASTSKPEAALAALGAALTHEDARVREVAISVLDELRLPESLPALTAALARYPGDKALAALVAALSAAELDPSWFPSGAAGDAKLDAALAALPASPHSWGFKQPPALRWASGARLSAGARDWFWGALYQESLENREPMLTSVRERLSDAECAAALVVLLAGQSEHWRFRRQRAFAGPMLGDEAILNEVARQLEALVGSRDCNYGRDPLAGLARRGSPAAIRAIEWASRRSGSNTMRRRCAAQLEELAGWRELTVPELLDSAMGDLGFDARGEQTLDFGGRVMTLRLTPENAVELVDEDGKPRASPPSARKDDDQAAYKEAKGRFSAIKKELKRLHSAQKQRMEVNLASQRRWPIATWRDRFQRHPVMHAYSRSLVWESVDGAGAVLARFTVTEERELVDAELDQVSLEGAVAVRLLHPVNADAEALDAWREIFADNEIVPFFPQLDRPVYRLGELPEDDEALFDSLPTPTAGPMMGTTQRLGYTQGERGDGGGVYHHTRKLERYTLTLKHDGLHPYAPELDLDFRGIAVTRDGEAVAWRTLPAALVSEIVYDLHRLTGAAK